MGGLVKFGDKHFARCLQKNFLDTENGPHRSKDRDIPMHDAYMWLAKLSSTIA